MMSLVPKFIAVLLAVGGAGWALMLSIAALKMGWTFIAHHFGVGFIIWLGWIARAALSLDLTTRRLIWVGSVCLHLWWLIRILGSGANEPALQISWWSAALFLSLTALVLERRKTGEQAR